MSIFRPGLLNRSSVTGPPRLLEGIAAKMMPSLSCVTLATAMVQDAETRLGGAASSTPTPSNKSTVCVYDNAGIKRLATS